MRDDKILNRVCYELGVNYIEAQSKRRFGELVWARQVYCYIRHKYEWDLQPPEARTKLGQIGWAVNLDHACVLHAVKVVRHECETYPDVRNRIHTLERMLYLRGLLRINPNIAHDIATQLLKTNNGIGSNAN